MTAYARKAALRSAITGVAILATLLIVIFAMAPLRTPGEDRLPVDYGTTPTRTMPRTAP